MNTIKFKTLIIGGGISGCIMGHLLKNNYLVLERNRILGGEMSNTILGPKLYHDTPETRNLFREYVVSTRSVKTITLLDCVKTDDKSTYDKKIGYSFSNSQNSSISAFSALNLDLTDFYDDVCFESAQVLSIDKNKHFVYCLVNKQLVIFEYDNLVSTIDFELLCRLSNIHNDYALKKRGVVYVSFNARYKNEFEYLNKYSFWYNLTESEFFRCTNVSTNYYTLELFIENTINIQEQISKYFNLKNDKLEYNYNPSAKIWIDSNNIIKYDTLKKYNIYLLGRNALYNHDRIQDVILSAKQIKKEIE